MENHLLDLPQLPYSPSRTRGPASTSESRQNYFGTDDLDGADSHCDCERGHRHTPAFRVHQEPSSNGKTYLRRFSRSAEVPKLAVNFDDHKRYRVRRC